MGTPIADRLEALGAKATAGEWEVRDHVVSPPHNLDRVKITPQHGPLGSLDRPDAELIVTLANNRQTFIDALRRVDALKADLDQQAKLKWEAYDANKRQAAEIARKDEALRAALEELWAPEAGCSCHVIPPCRDCVEYGSIRETQSVIRAALEARND